MLLAHAREVMDRHKVDANAAWTKRQEAVEKGEAAWLFGVAGPSAARFSPWICVLLETSTTAPCGMRRKRGLQKHLQARR